MKITIIGYSGAGKSTLAKELAHHYSLPLLHLDQLQFQPGWVNSDRQWMQEQINSFLHINKGWVIDGNYSWCSYQERMEQADQIIFLNFSRWNCLYRAFKRYLKYRNQVRESMAAGCTEKFDWEFIRWILWDGRTKHYKEQYQSVCDRYADKVTVLSSQKEIATFLKRVQAIH